MIEKKLGGRYLASVVGGTIVEIYIVEMTKDTKYVKIHFASNEETMWVDSIQLNILSELGSAI